MNFNGTLLLLLFTIIILLVQVIFVKTFSLFENKNDSLFELLNLHKEEYSKAIWYGVPYRCSTIAVARGFGIKTSEFQYGHFYFEEFFTTYPFLKWNKSLLKKKNMIRV